MSDSHNKPDWSDGNPLCHRHDCYMPKMVGVRYSRYWRCPYGDMWLREPESMSLRQARWQGTVLYRWWEMRTRPRLKLDFTKANEWHEALGVMEDE